MHTDQIMLTAAAAAHESTLPPRTARTIEWAIQRVLADLASFAGALATACAGRDNVSSDWFLRFPERLAEADDGTLLHIALVSEDQHDGATALQALGLLKRRYLERESVRVQALADEYGERLTQDISPL